MEREYVFNYYRHELGFLGDGISNRPEPPDELYSRVRNAVYTIISDDFKYAYSAADDREYLIDRKVDPRETRNVAGNPFHAADLSTMRTALIGELTRAGCTEGIADGSWRRFPPLASVGPNDPVDAGLLLQDQAWAVVDLAGYQAPALQVDPIAATGVEDA